MALGADSCNLSTNTINGSSLIQLAKSLYGAYPAFWGRYFNGTSTTSCEYEHAQEDNALHNAGIKVLPIARQTANVGGTQQQGTTDAQNNISDLFASFPEYVIDNGGNGVYLFLDVEGAPSMSAEYWAGWGNQVYNYGTTSSGRQLLNPCLYASQDDSATWQALDDANNNYGVGCLGVWVASYKFSGCVKETTWDSNYTTPSVAVAPPVLLWQYADDCHGSSGFDCELTNPSYPSDSWLLPYLITPPTN